METRSIISTVLIILLIVCAIVIAGYFGLGYWKSTHEGGSEKVVDIVTSIMAVRGKTKPDSVSPSIYASSINIGFDTNATSDDLFLVTPNIATFVIDLAKKKKVRLCFGWGGTALTAYIDAHPSQPLTALVNNSDIATSGVYPPLGYDYYFMDCRNIVTGAPLNINQLYRLAPKSTIDYLSRVHEWVKLQSEKHVAQNMFDAFVNLHKFAPIDELSQLKAELLSSLYAGLRTYSTESVKFNLSRMTMVDQFNSEDENSHRNTIEILETFSDCIVVLNFVYNWFKHSESHGAYDHVFIADQRFMSLFRSGVEKSEGLECLLAPTEHSHMIEIRKPSDIVAWSAGVGASFDFERIILYPAHQISNHYSMFIDYNARASHANSGSVVSMPQLTEAIAKMRAKIPNIPIAILTNWKGFPDASNGDPTIETHVFDYENCVSHTNNAAVTNWITLFDHLRKIGNGTDLGVLKRVLAAMDITISARQMLNIDYQWNQLDGTPRPADPPDVTVVFDALCGIYRTFVDHFQNDKRINLILCEAMFDLACLAQIRTRPAGVDRKFFIVVRAALYTDLTRNAQRFSNTEACFVGTASDVEIVLPDFTTAFNQPVGAPDGLMSTLVDHGIPIRLQIAGIVPPAPAMIPFVIPPPPPPLPPRPPTPAEQLLIEQTTHHQQLLAQQTNQHYEQLAQRAHQHEELTDRQQQFMHRQEEQRRQYALELQHQHAMQHAMQHADNQEIRQQQGNMQTQLARHHAVSQAIRQQQIDMQAQLAKQHTDHMKIAQDQQALLQKFMQDQDAYRKIAQEQQVAQNRFTRDPQDALQQIMQTQQTALQKIITDDLAKYQLGVQQTRTDNERLHSETARKMVNAQTAVLKNLASDQKTILERFVAEQLAIQGRFADAQRAEQQRFGTQITQQQTDAQQTAQQEFKRIQEGAQQVLVQQQSETQQVARQELERMQTEFQHTLNVRFAELAQPATILQPMANVPTAAALHPVTHDAPTAAALHPVTHDAPAAAALHPVTHVVTGTDVHPVTHDADAPTAAALHPVTHDAAAATAVMPPDQLADLKERADKLILASGHLTQTRSDFWAVKTFWVNAGDLLDNLETNHPGKLPETVSGVTQAMQQIYEKKRTALGSFYEAELGSVRRKFANVKQTAVDTPSAAKAATVPIFESLKRLKTIGGREGMELGEQSVLDDLYRELIVFMETPENIEELDGGGESVPDMRGSGFPTWQLSTSDDDAQFLILNGDPNNLIGPKFRPFDN
jgi:hypothetical protein